MKNRSLFLVTAFIAICHYGFSQSTVSGIGFGNTRTTGLEFLGWNNLGVSGSLNIRNDFANQPINFLTGGATLGFQRMTIRPNGFVGIGNGFTNPIFRLDVDNDININWQNIGDGYRQQL
ncbi:MAG: hypothetical protein AB1458_10550 [Bacteroidota bacterium]